MKKKVFFWIIVVVVVVAVIVLLRVLQLWNILAIVIYLVICYFAWFCSKIFYDKYFKK